MHPFWNPIIRPCLELLKPRTVVEIGTDAAQTTRPLAILAREKGFSVHTIDPAPKIDAEALVREFEPHLAFHQSQSLNVLPALADADCILIDGDHNWYTVIHELRIIARTAREKKTTPLVLLHDVEWPYARRDLYYTPERIPEMHRQPYETAAIDPATDELTNEPGFNPEHHHAVFAHGIRNGVRGAVEDFLDEQPFWEFHSVPGFGGLGILAPRALYDARPDLLAFIERTVRATETLKEYIGGLERARIDGIVLGERLSAVWKKLDERDTALRISQAAEQHLQRELDTVRGERHRLTLETAQLRGELQALQAEAARVSGELAHTFQTLSWRITQPLRSTQAWLRLHVKNELSFPLLKSVWVALGEPFPDAARYVRHTLIGGLGRRAPPSAPAVPPAPERLPDVAVVIPCHNYGRFLREAVDSVLAQTHRPAEIVIVDDSSTDDTAKIARSYADRGVRYLRGEWRNVGAARNAGLSATRAPYLVFLDADDMLHPEYLRSGVRVLEGSPKAGIAYADHYYFGLLKEYVKTPPKLDWELFDTVNLINAASMVRRQALVQAGGWSLLVEQHADWITWRRILRLGWQAVRSEGLRYYRVHGAAMTDDMKASLSYVEQAGFLTEQATLCLSLSGRRWAWPLMRDFLERQTFPHALIHLIILDTSQDPALAAEVREWLSRCDYPEVTYRAMEVGIKGVADLPRHEVAQEIGIACSTIYNTFARMAETPLVFILEDDVIPPDDAFPRLIRSFEADVISVSGLYWHRDKPKPVCWDWDENGRPVFPEPASGVRNIGGTGFGCLVIRGEFFRRTVFQAGPPFGNYDHNFFASLTRGTRYRALIDWDCLCRHYQSPEIWF